MPKFMGNYQQYDVKQIGWMSAIPYLLQTVTVLGATWFSDFLRVSFKGVTRLEHLKKSEQIWIQKSLYSKIICVVGNDISSDILAVIEPKWMQLQNYNCISNTQSVFLCI